MREYGCYGCHEINGFDGPNEADRPRSAGRAELRRSGRADSDRPRPERRRAQLAPDAGRAPDDDAARDQLARAIRADAALQPQPADSDPAPPEAADAAPQPPRLTPATHALADALKDVEAPGRLRKVGPSLRHLDSKVDYDWLYSWIRRPADFRPTTRMPQFFGHLEHLRRRRTRSSRSTTPPATSSRSPTASTRERFEDIEIRALAEFLLANSQPFEYLDPPQGITEAPSAERGKWLFESRGCLACHSHNDFPGIASNAGPRPVARRRQVQHGQGPALALQLAQGAEPLPPAHGDAERVPRSDRREGSGRQPDRQGDRSGRRHRGVPARACRPIGSPRTCRQPRAYRPTTSRRSTI